MNKVDTKQMLADSIMRLMMANSIDDITVQEIVDQCGTSRQTFYHHFSDKYALVDWIYRTEAVDFMTLVGTECSWYDAVISKLYIIKRNPKFYKKVYRQEWFIQSFTNITRQLYMDTVERNAPNGMTEDLQFMVEFYVIACVKKTSEWVLHDCKTSPEKMVLNFLSCLPEGIRHYLVSDEDANKLKCMTKDS